MIVLQILGILFVLYIAWRLFALVLALLIQLFLFAFKILLIVGFFIIAGLFLRYCNKDGSINQNPSPSYSYAIPVPGNKRYVVSPFSNKGFIDIRGMNSVSIIKDPYSTNNLIVP